MTYQDLKVGQTGEKKLIIMQTIPIACSHYKIHIILPVHNSAFSLGIGLQKR
jgi:hypothetical protein